MKALWELRKVINSLLRAHGKPDIIRLEMAREMKQTEKKRRETEQRQTKLTKMRDAAKKSGRTPVFDPRLAYLLARLGRSAYDEGAKVFLERCGSMIYSPGDYSNSKHKVGDMALSDWSSKPDIVVDIKHMEDGVCALDLNADPSGYVLHLDYFRKLDLKRR